MSGNPSMEQEAASIAFEQAAWWRSRGLSAANAADMLGIKPSASWMDVERTLRSRWTSAVQIIAVRDHRSAA